MILPVQKSIPAARLQDYFILIYGREKIGKTTLCAEFEDTLMLMCEPGGKAISAYQLPIRSWAEFLEAIKLLQTSPRFKTIAVDTADSLYNYCMAHMLQKMGVEHASDEDWGKGWELIRREFEKQIYRLLRLNRGVIMTSHEKVREIKRVFKDPVSQVVPSMANGARAVLEPMVDIWGYYSYTDKGRRLLIRGNSDIHAGCRLEKHFVGVESIDMGNSAKEAYLNFKAAFDKTEADFVATKKSTTLKLGKKIGA